jgi:hypothetical protein
MFRLTNSSRTGDVANLRFAVTVTARDAVQQITRIVLMRIAGVNLNENDSHQYY